ncbi:hypothetical protein TNCV_622771 [Trichonephila clavipes]|nr:hypothetical protein TNCV_622771 [Trichonephila clavipes]
MGCKLVINHCRPKTSLGSWYHFLVRCPIGGYQSPQLILKPSFLPGKRSLSSEDANLYQDLILPRATKPNRYSRAAIAKLFDQYIHNLNPVDH